MPPVKRTLILAYVLSGLLVMLLATYLRLPLSFGPDPSITDLCGSI